MSGLYALLCGYVTVDDIRNPGRPGNDWTTVVLMWAMLAVPLVPTLLLGRRRAAVRRSFSLPTP
jgi:hypothetical protein